mgnify:CR=1 FL=1
MKTANPIFSRIVFSDDLLVKLYFPSVAVLFCLRLVLGLS